MSLNNGSINNEYANDGSLVIYKNKMKKPEPERSLANAPTSKKIGFISAIMIVIGSSVGAGIFFKSSKVLEYSGANLYWAIFAWVVAAFAVICMALALIEIASARNDNLSLIGWCKEFNGKYIYKGCKYFMTFIYLPLTFFFMPIYVIVSLQDALAGFGVNNSFNTANDWAIWMVIVLVISVYFIFVCGLSSKATNIQNWIITSLKFIPLAVVAILGFVLAAMPVTDATGTVISGGINNTDAPEWWNNKAVDFFNLTPGFGIFGAMAAIFFAFDGFYVTAGLQSEMKEPKKTPKAIFIGLVIVTIIYLTIAISMSLGSAGGSFYSFQDWLKSKNVSWLFGVINILIAVGVLGIINGFGAWAPRFVEDLVQEGELVVPTKSLVLLNKPRPWLGTLYTCALSIPAIIIFCTIGGLGYFPGGYAGAYDGAGFSSQAKLINFADLMATWVSLFAFGFIAFAIFGGLMNRKTNRVQTEQNKYFKFTGWASFILVSFSLLLSVIQPFVNTGLVGHQIGLSDTDLTNLINNSNDPNWSVQDYRLSLNDSLTGNILLCVILFTFAGICFGPVLIEEKSANKRYNRLETLRNLINHDNEICTKAKTAIMQNNMNDFANVLKTNFNVNDNDANYVATKLVAFSKYKYLMQVDSSFNFKKEALWSLDKQIELTSICIDNYNNKHWYFVRKAPH
ncbi:APC family permease [Mycoplasmoides alvi]|uniref:APC family permease n=1 Tax=Mycoplasmoides alvi TaxID=78580 RepID=UPI0006987FB9|nr:APC family permease [Mycoplasmoides alvi]